MDFEKDLPLLTAPELRVLGALIEKSKTTPEYYPMTINALTAACNQKTSRHPVVDYSEETVMAAINSLKAQSLVATAVGGGSRSVKYKHNFATVYPVSDAELAVLCLLFLRGPQTPGELNSNSGRLHAFSSLGSVQQVLIDLASRNPPFVKELSRRPGQKEARYAHLLGGAVAPDEEQSPEQAPQTRQDLEARVSLLEKEVTEMKELLSKITKELY